MRILISKLYNKLASMLIIINLHKLCIYAYLYVLIYILIIQISISTNLYLFIIKHICIQTYKGITYIHVFKYTQIKI